MKETALESNREIIQQRKEEETKKKREKRELTRLETLKKIQDRTTEYVINEFTGVNIVDERMGVGKTSAAINMINADTRNVNYIYITPYITEIDRIINSCPNKHFVQPTTEDSCDEYSKTKLSSLKRHLADGKNIASTHALFRSFDEEVMGYIKEGNYILILDEVINAVDSLGGINSADDINIAKKFLIHEDERGFVKFNNESYDGDAFRELKKLCDMDMIVVGTVMSDGEDTFAEKFLMRILKKDLFECFKEVFILTYMFECQYNCYYFKIFDIPYRNVYVNGKSVSTYKICTSKDEDRNKYNYKKLITIVADNENMNLIGKKINRAEPLCSTWYNCRSDKELDDTIRKKLTSFFKNKSKSCAGNSIWTVYSSKKFKCAPFGLTVDKLDTKGFVPFNKRATNEYSHCMAAAFAINLFMPAEIKNWIQKSDIVVDEEQWALSEMLQWIWRTRIRNNQPIYLYIPSERMRRLMRQWIEDNSSDDGIGEDFKTFEENKRKKKEEEKANKTKKKRGRPRKETTESKKTK